MTKQHLSACLALKTGNANDCHCNDEVNHYLGLAMVSIVVFLVELVGGIMTGSLALISDAFHVLVDGTESIISVVVSFFARRSADEKALRKNGGRVSALLLIGVALWIIGVEVPERLQNPHLIDADTMLFVASVGLIANCYMAWKHTHVHAEHKNETHAWQWTHIAVDTGASVLVIFSGVVIKVTGLVIIDPILSFMLACLILYIALSRLFGKVSGHVNSHSCGGHGHDHHR